MNNQHHCAVQMTVILETDHLLMRMSFALLHHQNQHHLKFVSKKYYRSTMLATIAMVFLTIVPRPISAGSLSSMDIDTHQNSTREPEYEILTQVKSIISALSTNGSRDDEPIIINLYRIAEEAKRMLGASKAVHVIITSTECDEKTTVYTLFSNLLCSALDISNPKSSIASQAILAMFLVLKEVSLLQ